MDAINAAINPQVKRYVKEALAVIVGSFVFAVGLDCFEVPNGIAAGGASGLATVISKVASDHGFMLPVGMQVIAMNALLMIAVVRTGCKRYLARTIAGVLATALFTDILAPVLPALGQDDLLLAALMGGTVCGLGLGLVFRVGANTGGTDIVAQLISRKTAISVGFACLLVDLVVIAVSIPVFGMENALYSSVAMYLSSRFIDTVVDGLGVQRAAFIISQKPKEIEQLILRELDRGCTSFEASGSYTGRHQRVLYVVMGRQETSLLKSMVAEVDSHAIVFISEVHEAFGEGFREFAE